MDRVKSKNITKWLDKEFKKVTSPPLFYLKNNELNFYYKGKNDRNLLLNNKQKLKELKIFGSSLSNKSNYKNENEKIYHKKLIFESKLVQTYNNGNNKYYHYLNPKTPRYHANMLFNKMIDYCIENNLSDHLNRPLINKELRNSFYKFCFENSK